jgi:CheY-like chemotaxis protein
MNTCGRTILIVDDSTEILELLELVLARSHHTVLRSCCADEALSHWQRLGQQVDLLITDVRLDESESGLDLAERLLALKPSLKVLAITGYFGAEQLRRCRQRMELLAKPFSFLELQTRVEALLSGDGSPEITAAQPIARMRG